MPKKLIIAIDGPAGSGKSTTAREVASRIGYVYIDTGAMYRAVTFMALRENIIGSHAQVSLLLKSSEISIEASGGENKIFWNGEDITSRLRSLDVNENVSEISSIPDVREELIHKQRSIGRNGGVVMEGRDIGTVVFPHADLKFFLTASLEERTKRRYKEVVGTEKVDEANIRKNLSERDVKDSGRSVSPLKKADGAIEIDTSNLTFEEQVTMIVDKIRSAEEQFSS
ncbi:MAG: (d)CMP kinase [Ignavibacteriales bacterium]|nr:(d)CMP kinase [Ignavibacteriaceae bacterium]QOJ29641.1 MAG: (d)CMP kinase [Ignavibacteriales bacterium]